MTSCLLHISQTEKETVKYLSPSLLLPVYPLYLYPDFSMAHSSQLVTGSVSQVKDNVINTVSGCHSTIKYPATVAVWLVSFSWEAAKGNIKHLRVLCKQTEGKQ